MFLRSEPEYYDLILMDVQMPVMNGHLSKPIDMNAVKALLMRFLGRI